MQTRCFGNVKSGRPGDLDCRRHPLMPAARKFPQSSTPLKYSRAREFRDINRERSSGEKKSRMIC